MIQCQLTINRYEYDSAGSSLDESDKEAADASAMPNSLATAEMSAAFLWERPDDVAAKSGETEIRCRAGCGVRFCRCRVKGKHSLCRGTQGWNTL